MLPAHRVIGHKEYGNTAPGGWPGRKTDPVYDMNGRRAAVANFQPRTGFTDQEDFMATMSDAEKAELLDFVRRAPIYIWNDQNGNPLIMERNGGKPRTARDVQGDIYVHTALLVKQVAGLTAAVNTLAAGAAGEGTTAEELRAVIREEMANAVDVQVTVNGVKADPVTGPVS